MWVYPCSGRRSYKETLKFIKKRTSKLVPRIDFSFLFGRFLPLKKIFSEMPKFYLVTFAGHGSVYTDVTPIDGRKRETDNVREENEYYGE